MERSSGNRQANFANRREELSGYGITLRPIHEDDLEQLLSWRNRHDIRIMMKNQEPISLAQHRAWHHSISSKPEQQHFAIEYKGVLIGSANIRLLQMKDAKQTHFEPGLYIGHEEYKSNILAFAPSLVLNDYCFGFLSASKLKATVHKSNQAAIAYNTKLGYRLSSLSYSEQDEWLTMLLNYDDYQHATKVIRGFLSR